MKRNYRLIALLCIVVAVFAACAGKDESSSEPKDAMAAETKTDIDKVRSEIQSLEDAFAAGEKAKDAEAVAAYYADDATSYSRNEPPSVGKAAIKAKIERDMAKDTSGDYSVYKIVDLFAEGNTATEIGSWTMMNKAGEKTRSGYYMSYFEKRDGKYKCVRDMSVMNSEDKPAKTP